MALRRAVLGGGRRLPGVEPRERDAAPQSATRTHGRVGSAGPRRADVAVIPTPRLASAARAALSRARRDPLDRRVRLDPRSGMSRGRPPARATRPAGGGPGTGGRDPVAV